MDQERQPVREENPGAQNPWQNPAALSKVRGGDIALFTVLWILSSMLIPLADRINFTVPGRIALIAGMFYLTRKRISGGIFTMICTAILWQANFYGANLGVVLLAAVTGILAGTYLLTCRRFFWLLPVGTAVAGVLTYLYAGNLTRAVFCVILLPAAALLGSATLLGEWRRTAIRFAMVGVLIGILAAGAWYVIDRFGTLNQETIRALTNGWRSHTEQTFFTWREDVIRAARLANATDTGAQTTLSELEASVRSQWSDTTLTNLAGTLQVILPAAILIFCQTVAFLSQKLLCGAYLTVGPKEVVQLENEYMTASVPAAVIYVAAFGISLFGGATDSLSFAVAENVYLVFLPALLFVGVRVYLGRLVQSSPAGRTIWLILLLAAICCSFPTAMAILGLLGAWNTIAGAIARAARNRMQDDE